MVPINEDKVPLRPVTPYGVSKSAMEMMARQFHLNYKMDFVLPRLFIHLGPDHPPVTAIQNFARQLAAIKLGLQPPVIKVGNLESARDFVDVRDGVKALWVLAGKGVSGEVYNLCSGKAYTMKESLEYLIEISGLQVRIEIDPNLFRPTDEKLLLGDPSKIGSLGWKAGIPFKQTLSDIYNNWLKRQKAG
jgi:GDP-4-dehydro-6-deoxy-D-mannose reductase